MSEFIHITDATVDELMTRQVVSVRPDTTLAAVTRLMVAHPFNGFPVVDEMGVLHGVVTRGDLLKCHLAPYCRFMDALEDTWTESVAVIMTRHPISLYAYEPALKAIQLVVDHRLRTIPVVEDSACGPRLIGVVSRGDLTRAICD
ncbi:MAG TPA: CBS domain-containing protein [Candidatus Binatia bacterium]|nr:CBS domain-containing protein [Candidatus Binatia bacterium]